VGDWKSRWKSKTGRESAMDVLELLRASATGGFNTLFSDAWCQYVSQQITATVSALQPFFVFLFALVCLGNDSESVKFEFKKAAVKEPAKDNKGSWKAW